MFQFFVTPGFIADLQKLDESIQNQIKEKIDFFRQVENPLAFAKKLHEKSHLFRFRAGHYRIVFEMRQNKLFLLAVDHRKDIYRKNSL